MYRCCVILADGVTNLQVSATQFYFLNNGRQTGNVSIARQYTCELPLSSPLPYMVTLVSSTQCPRDLSLYVIVEFPPSVPGGLGLCARVSHSDGLHPESLIEWFEMQVG